jgi:hypothetical protein
VKHVYEGEFSKHIPGKKYFASAIKDGKRVYEQE